MVSPFNLVEDKKFYGFAFNYFLGKERHNATYTTRDRLEGEFLPSMLRVNGQYFSDGSAWWEFMASGQGRMFSLKRQLSEGIPSDMADWQQAFVNSALDRMQYEIGTAGEIADESLQLEKFLIKTESYVGFQSIRTWENAVDESILETLVTLDGDSLQTTYQKDGLYNTYGSETAPVPAPGKNPEEALLWSREGYRELFKPQIDDVLLVARATPRTSLGFRKGKHEIKLNLRNKVESVIVGGIYKAVGLS